MAPAALVIPVRARRVLIVSAEIAPQIAVAPAAVAHHVLLHRDDILRVRPAITVGKFSLYETGAVCGIPEILRVIIAGVAVLAGAEVADGPRIPHG